MAAERQVPGGPFVNEVATAQRQIPGGPYLNETVSAAVSVTAGIGSLTVAGLAPTLALTGLTTTVSPGIGALTVAGLVPVIRRTSSVATGLGVLTVAGLVPVAWIDWRLPTSITVNTGSITSGALADTYTSNDSRLQLAETTGPTGFSYDFGFERVPDGTAQEVYFEGYYTGNLAHNVKIRQYNFSTLGWEDLTADATDFANGVADYIEVFPLKGNTGNYWSGGQIRLRIIHTSPGNLLHVFAIDRLVLATDFAARPGVASITAAGLAPTLQPVTYDYLNAASDVTAGGWTANAGGDLYAAIDEQPADDADYIRTSTVDAECEIALEVGNAPSIAGYMNLQIQIPAGFSPVGTLTVTLMNGAAQVQQWVDASPAAGVREYAVTETVPAYNNLRVKLKATA